VTTARASRGLLARAIIITPSQRAPNKRCARGYRQSLLRFLENGQEDALLVVEVVIEGALRHAGATPRSSTEVAA